MYFTVIQRSSHAFSVSGISRSALSSRLLSVKKKYSHNIHTGDFQYAISRKRIFELDRAECRMYDIGLSWYDKICVSHRLTLISRDLCKDVEFSESLISIPASCLFYVFLQIKLIPFACVHYLTIRLLIRSVCELVDASRQLRQLRESSREWVEINYLSLSNVC